MRGSVNIGRTFENSIYKCMENFIVLPDILHDIVSDEGHKTTYDMSKFHIATKSIPMFKIVIHHNVILNY